MATLDDGVQNLRQFVGNLTTAIGALQQVTDHVEDCTRAASQIEDLVTQHGGALNDDLEEARGQLDSGQAEAIQALAELAQAATASQGTLDQGHDVVRQAAGHFEAGLQSLSSDLDEEHGHLTQDGFEKLGQIVEETEGALETARQESEQTWTELEGAVRGFETHAQPSWDASDTALEQAAADTESGGASLEAEGTACVQAFEAAGADLEGACTTLDEDLRNIYDGYEGAIDSECGELVEAMVHLTEEAMKQVETGGHEQLEDPATLVETEGLDALGGEYSMVEAWVTAAEAVAGIVDPLAEELLKCKAVVGEVDELMNALAG